MRIIFMGSPAFALPTLEALHASDHEIVAIYTQPPRPAGRGKKETPTPVHQFGQAHGLPVYTPASLKTPEAQAEFAAHQADIAVVVAYGLLLPKPILDATPRGCINVHPSALPRWRGAAPIHRTIMAGDTHTAIVIMQMDEGLDTGDMLLVKPYNIPPGCTTGQLHDTLATKAAPLVLEVIVNNPKRIKQPVDGVEYAHKISKEECRIHWSQPAETIHHQILGLSPAPGAFFEYKDEHIKILDADLETEISLNPGQIVIQENALFIGCNAGAIKPTRLQRPGKKAMNVQEFLHGFSL